MFKSYALENFGNTYAEDGDKKCAVEFHLIAAKVQRHTRKEECRNMSYQQKRLPSPKKELGKNEAMTKCLWHVLHVKLLKVGKKHEESQKTMIVYEDTPSYIGVLMMAD